MTFSYAESGVNIDAGNELVSRIKPVAKATHRPGVLAGLGGFGALFELPIDRYRQPVLVSGTDGVGTKLKLAIRANRHDTIGIDLVAMCVNDLIVCGAEPLYFLDYYATGKLNVDQAQMIIAGIGKGCELANCALIGGETAEMPGMYHDEDYDLAGFSVGIVEKNNIIDGSKVKAGDVIIGISSSGPHSNGYSLIRNIIDDKTISLDTPIGDISLIDALLAPTKIYVKSILSLQKKVDIHALAHITGGGFIENIPRILPAFTQANLQKNTWEMPLIFDWLQQQAQCDWTEMYKTFNCGIGMIIIVDQAEVETTLACLQASGEAAHIIGAVAEQKSETPSIKIV